jgi:hypothetical protein
MAARQTPDFKGPTYGTFLKQEHSCINHNRFVTQSDRIQVDQDAPYGSPGFFWLVTNLD